MYAQLRNSLDAAISGDRTVDRGNILNSIYKILGGIFYINTGMCLPLNDELVHQVAYTEATRYIRENSHLSSVEIYRNVREMIIESNSFNEEEIESICLQYGHLCGMCNTSNIGLTDERQLGVMEQTFRDAGYDEDLIQTTIKFNRRLFSVIDGRIFLFTDSIAKEAIQIADGNGVNVDVLVRLLVFYTNHEYQHSLQSRLWEPYLDGEVLAASLELTNPGYAHNLNELDANLEALARLAEFISVKI